MDVNALGAFGSYAYQSILSQTGNANQAYSQALSAGSSQAASRTFQAPPRVDPVDAMAALDGGTPDQASTASANAPAMPSAPQALLNAFLGSNTSAFSASDSLPSSALALSPANSEALIRYAYDQSQNPNAVSQVSSSTQPPTASLNLLA